MNPKIKLGVIADDFTGAGDAASFLVKAGHRVVMLTEVPKSFQADCECIVMAMKIRSADPQKALEDVAHVLNFFENIGVDKIYYKYCSTFDSTPKGNVGVIGDYLLERLNVPYTVLCPSLPVNGRTVEDGILYVNGVALAESPMKNHPLNPMWDSYIPNLMKEQSHYPCYVLKRETMKEQFSKFMEKSEKFYVIPDYITDNDGKWIAETFRELPLYTGGSGLLEHLDLGADQELQEQPENECQERAVILCGSCSRMTGKQIQNFIEAGHPSVRIDSKKLLHDEITAESVFAEVTENLPETTIVYSDGVEKEMPLFSKMPFFQELSAKIEALYADLSEMALKSGFNKIIVAGGETSGAVTIRLGYHAYRIGRVIAPGVPTLLPVEAPALQLVLKSGNFGDEEFFTKAMR